MNPEGRLAYRGALVLATIVTLGTTARAWDLAHPSVSYDELSDFVQSVAFCSAGDWREPADGYLNGQLSFSLACAVYRWVPPSPLVPRALSVAFAALTVLATFLLATRFVPRGWALLAAALVATSTFDVAASRLGFSHGHRVHVPFVIVGLYLVLAEGARRLPSLLAAGLSLGLAVGTDLLAAFTLLSALCWVLYSSRGDGSWARCALSFGAGVAAGAAVASPMYLFHPWLALTSISEQLGRWDGLRGYLWLGEVRDRIPAYYYALVLALKGNPVVLALAGAGAAVAILRPTDRRIFLCASFWPIAYLSLKGWKSPFYVAAFLPLLAVLAAFAVSELCAWKGRAAAAAATLLAVAVDAWAAHAVHPDYLMGSIQWDEALYGEFQGPAVSHGQWIGEAFEFIRSDSAGANPLVLVPRGVAGPQLRYYAGEFGLEYVDDAGWADPRARVWVRSRARYVVLNQDCFRLVSPLHPDTVQANAELVSLVLPPSPFRLARTFGSAAFPMVWVFRRD